MEGEIRALTPELSATEDDLRRAMSKIKVLRGNDGAAKKCGVKRSKRKNHKNVTKEDTARRHRAGLLDYF